MNLRLLLTAECNRRCRGCCNKGFDLSGLPVCTHFAGYDCIMLTGGEPLLDPAGLQRVIATIRAQTAAPIILYTAWRGTQELLTALAQVDGLTLTLHTRGDVAPFLALNERLQAEPQRVTGKSLRLNVFRDIGEAGRAALAAVDLSYWQIKSDVQWIKDCPLPADEVFMRFAPADQRGT